ATPATMSIEGATRDGGSARRGSSRCATEAARNRHTIATGAVPLTWLSWKWA
ncbi:unnamed protein product, partial [Symbiodinium necroappetens]